MTALRLHSTLFEVASVAMIAVAATPKPLDSNGGLNGAIHTAAAFVYFVAAAAGAVSSSPGQPRAGVAYLLVIVTAVFNVSIFDAVGLRKTSGLYQRLCFALVVLWIMLPG